ncbi:MAG: hypothetical protein ACI915_000033 [Gammaproteobacteria bacterium]|jgi:hypothetical protein
MEHEKIEVELETGQSLAVVVFSKTANKIQVVLGEGAHSMKCDLLPTRNGMAYAGSLKGREIIYPRSQADVQADLDAVNPALRKSRPRQNRT